MNSLFPTKKEGPMIRIDGYYLYNVASAIHPLGSVSDQMTYDEAWLTALIAKGELERFITSSVYRPQTSASAASELTEAIDPLIEKKGVDRKIDSFEAYVLNQKLSAFETVLKAELGLQPLYLVTQKRGYDVKWLIERGAVLFPDELELKVPDAIQDINSGARCLAFELPTASAFHFHRANESVLHRYYDAVTNSNERPKSRNMGDYINALQNGNPHVIAALKSLKDLHRNPLIHPEHSIDSVDDAIAILNAVHTAVVAMLKEIPTPQADVPPVSASID